MAAALTTPRDDHKLSYGHGLVPRANITDGAGRALLCFTPIHFRKTSGILPFVTMWERTEVITEGPVLNKITGWDIAAVKTVLKTYESTAFPGFIDEHESWQGKRGLAYFSAYIELPEAMRLQFLMGYDGPFRLWINENPFWNALKATNPCYADEGVKSMTLAKGKHRLRVAMDLNNGSTWGFCVRMRRLDLTKKQIHTGIFLKPIYSV